MKGGGAAILRKVLAILPVVRGHQGIRVSELSRLTGIPESEIVSDLPDLVNLCGVPPYSPADLVDLEVEGDRVRIRFAEQFRRPVRLTSREALALDMALSGWEEEEEEGPFSRAVSAIRMKVRGALSPEVAEEVEQVGARISAPGGPGLAGRNVSFLKEALCRQVEVRMEYFSHRTGSLSVRTVRPYGIFEQGGHWYLVAHSSDRDREMTFRADRIRSAKLTETEYEIPEDFEVVRFRSDEPPDPGEGGMEAEVLFDAEIARFVRESFPATEMREEPDGSLWVRARGSGTFWLVTRLLPWGSAAHVLAPPELRRELRDAAKKALELYGG